MKITTSSITLNNKAHTATEVDYDSYNSESATLEMNDKEYSATKVYGEEDEEE